MTGSVHNTTRRTRRRRPCLRITFLACGLAVLCNGSLCSAEELERELLKRAPQVIRFLKERGYKNVGVLKFRVKKGNAPISDGVGTLNSFLTERLEVALILANRTKGKETLGIVHDADSVAATIPGASHASASGRKKLFSKKYPLAWGVEKKTVSPDAFVTGLVIVSPDLRDMQVGLLVFDRESSRLERMVPVFTAPVDLDTLAELGESFSLRGAFDSGKIKLVKTNAIKDAVKVKTLSSPHPLADPNAQIALELFYDRRRIPIRFENGQASVPEPQEGQKVSLVLKRTSQSEGRLAVVLKVNGENTLYRQRKRDIDCTKWILAPDAPPIGVRGYQKTVGTLEPFRVLSRTESKQEEVYYGKDVGMISITVFRESPSDRKPADLPDEEAEDLLAMLRGTVPNKRPQNLALLQRKLRESAHGGSGTRGLIGKGKEQSGKTRIVTFKADPTPVFAAAIQYYKP